jgi:hypothetical protein
MTLSHQSCHARGRWFDSRSRLIIYLLCEPVCVSLRLPVFLCLHDVNVRTYRTTKKIIFIFLLIWALLPILLCCWCKLKGLLADSHDNLNVVQARHDRPFNYMLDTLVHEVLYKVPNVKTKCPEAEKRKWLI